MPYSMMCRASTSETSSLSGSGIFFLSSTGRAGGCAGCGCSSSSSYQETSQFTSGHPRVMLLQPTCPLPTNPKTCHAFYLHILLIAQYMIFSFLSRVQTLLFKDLSGYAVLLLHPAPRTQCILLKQLFSSLGFPRY